jgi:hypothetical protein
MALWKAWSDTRGKFYLSVVLVTLLMAPNTVAVAVRSARAAAQVGTADPAAPEAALLQASQAFARSVEGWMAGNAHFIFAVLATVLAVGGTMAAANKHSNLMTLSLPVERRHWLRTQGLVAALLVFALCGWEVFILLVTGLAFGLPVPIGQLALATILTSLSAAVWVWPAILSTSFTRDSVKAALIIVSVMVAARTFTGLSGLSEWSLTRIADTGEWGGAVPWQPLFLADILTVISGWWAIRRFEAAEY